MTTIKTSYHLAKEYQQQIIKDSKQRGYNQELSEQYIQDRIDTSSKTAKTGDMVFGGVVAAMAAKIALGAKKLYDTPALIINKKIAVKMAIKKQFAPVMEQIKKVPLNKEEGLGLKWLAKESVVTVKLIGRSFSGVWKSIPPVVRIPAAILLGANAVKAIQDKATIDAKYDTLQYLENKKEQA